MAGTALPKLIACSGCRDRIDSRIRYAAKRCVRSRVKLKSKRGTSKMRSYRSAQDRSPLRLLQPARSHEHSKTSLHQRTTRSLLPFLAETPGLSLAFPLANTAMVVAHVGALSAGHSPILGCRPRSRRPTAGDVARQTREEIGTFELAVESLTAEHRRNHRKPSNRDLELRHTASSTRPRTQAPH